MTDTATTPAKSNAEVVLSAVQDLFAREQIVTRETLAELTGLKLTTIDDRLGQGPNGRRIHPDSLEQRRGDAVGLIEQGHQDMSGTHVRVAGSGRGLHSSTQGLLCLGRGGEAIHFACLSL